MDKTNKQAVQVKSYTTKVLKDALAYATKQGPSKLINISDSYTQTSKGNFTVYSVYYWG